MSRKGGGRGALPLKLFILFSLLGTGLVPRAAAQTVRGQILDKATLAPLEGVLVLLIDQTEREVDGALTNAAGRFLLKGTTKGTYFVRTDRIGYESVTSDPFNLDPGQTFGIELEAGQTAIQLEELRVEGEQKCVVRPEEGMEVARVWDEARKALTVQAWTEREGTYRFQVVGYQRDMDPNTRRIQREDRRVNTSLSRNPIRSLPVADLLANGFIRDAEDGSLNYFGPDASVLLSDGFLDTHCFRLTENEARPSIIGLTFEPVRQSSFRDVLGTLWLDRETGALQHLEYGYTWSRFAEAQGLARGRVEFEALPNGAWIVKKWWIRMPLLARDLSRAGGGRTGIYVSGIRETGGEIARISTVDRETIARAEGGSVLGLVWDSTRSQPLEGARVYLSGTSFHEFTDAQGRFLIDGVPEGAFTAGFIHPRLDALAIIPHGVEVEVASGEVTEVVLGVPSELSILLEACKNEERRWGTAVVAGVVRDKASGDSILGAEVRLDWQEVQRMGPGHLGAQNKWVAVTTDGDGRFTVCSVPSNELIVIQASFMDQRSDTLQLRVTEDSYTVVELELSR